MLEIRVSPLTYAFYLAVVGRAFEENRGSAIYDYVQAILWDSRVHETGGQS